MFHELFHKQQRRKGWHHAYRVKKRMFTCTRKSHNQYQACIWNVWWYIIMVKVLNEIYYIYVFPYFFPSGHRYLIFIFTDFLFLKVLIRAGQIIEIKRRILPIFPVTFWWNTNMPWRFNFLNIYWSKQIWDRTEQNHKFPFSFLICQEQGQEDSGITCTCIKLYRSIVQYTYTSIVNT